MALCCGNSEKRPSSLKVSNHSVVCFPAARSGVAQMATSNVQYIIRGNNLPGVAQVSQSPPAPPSLPPSSSRHGCCDFVMCTHGAIMLSRLPLSQRARAHTHTPYQCACICTHAQKAQHTRAHFASSALVHTARTHMLVRVHTPAYARTHSQAHTAPQSPPPKHGYDNGEGGGGGGAATLAPSLQGDLVRMQKPHKSPELHSVGTASIAVVWLRDGCRSWALAEPSI
jgi:hypothetical protein